MNDEYYMRLALELALKGLGKVNPNPLVGAVIVKDHEIIGEGYHKKYGGLHAERNALLNCTKSPSGATMYVTLEPCCHYGKTPPCTEAIIEHNISKVVIGTLDPNAKVSGKGVEYLIQAGIEVVVGTLEEQCKEINKVFFHFVTTQKPFVVMKYAMTMDGKIATAAGESKWITGDLARRRVHHDRNRYSAIMVGVGTVLSDNPLLTCRVMYGINPIRIVCDSNLITPLECNVIQTAKTIPTIIATTVRDQRAHKKYVNYGCKILPVSKKDNSVDLEELMVKLGELEIDSILLEGGATLNFSALNRGIVNKVECYIAPKIFGGHGAKTPVGGVGFSKISEAVQLKHSKIINVGDDFLIESEVEATCLQE